MYLVSEKPLLRNQSGFSLVEVLVALVILAIGLLGVAGLQNRSLSGNQGALYRSQAVLYANDIIERMRVNRAQSIVPANYTQAETGNPAAVTGLPTPAQQDLSGWIDQVNDLPGGTGQVTVSDLGNGRFLSEVIIKWNEKGAVQSVRVDTLL